MNKQEYLIITFHSLDDAMDLDAKQTSSMKGRLRYGKVEDFS